MNDPFDVDPNIYRDAAWTAHNQLSLIGSAYVTVSPGDMTRYQIAIVWPMSNMIYARNLRHGFRDERMMIGNPRHEMFVATQFSELAPWQGNVIGDVGYVASHFFARTADPNPWSVAALFQFLNALAEILEEHPLTTTGETT